MRIVIIFLFISNFTFAQYWGGQEINESDLILWTPQSEIEYQGVYHFGESESESTLNLFFTNNCIVGQISYGYWEKSTGFWKIQYITLTNISINTKAEFTSDQYSGQFVKFRTSLGHYIEGLKINNAWTSWIENSTFEIGNKNEISLKNVYSGKYPEASIRKLDSKEFKKMSISELKIMKNEIFARYGYIFKSNGKMDKYFRSQDWYIATRKDVSNFLTEIELYNIYLIKKFE